MSSVCIMPVFNRKQHYTDRIFIAVNANLQNKISLFFAIYYQLIQQIPS